MLLNAKKVERYFEERTEKQEGGDHKAKDERLI